LRDDLKRSIVVAFFAEKTFVAQRPLHKREVIVAQREFHKKEAIVAQTELKNFQAAPGNYGKTVQNGLPLHKSNGSP
jgi:hypothetical protein